MKHIFIGDFNVSQFAMIMAFYFFITYWLFPLVGYAITRDKYGAGYGFVIGSAISVALWMLVGQHIRSDVKKMY
jgi:hypothetical protein